MTNHVVANSVIPIQEITALIQRAVLVVFGAQEPHAVNYPLKHRFCTGNTVMIAYLDHSRDTRLPLHGNVAHDDTGPGQAKTVHDSDDFRHIGIIPGF